MQRVGIVGAGLMATQLATLFLRRLEVPVVISDVDPERVEQAVASIGSELEKLVSRGRLPEAKARFLAGAVVAGDGLDAYAGCDLVLEAVFEELGRQAAGASARSRTSSTRHACSRRTRRLCP